MNYGYQYGSAPQFNLDSVKSRPGLALGVGAGVLAGIYVLSEYLKNPSVANSGIFVKYVFLIFALVVVSSIHYSSTADDASKGMVLGILFLAIFWMYLSLCISKL